MSVSRRGFFKTAACAGVIAQAGCRHIASLSQLTVFPERKGICMTGFRAEPLGHVRIGIIGVGHRGSSAVQRLASIPNVTVTAICDLYEDRVSLQAKALTEKGKAAPKTFSGSKDQWRKLCESKDVDLVYICTPWLLHTPMAVYAMQCGKHAVTEVPSAMTVEQCWQLVDTAEQTRRHCMILENCCYGYSEMFALMLCRKGILGELVHGEGAYLHDLRESKLNEEASGGYQGQWRLEWAKQHTGNPYPTHGLGPICQTMGINRGDRFECLTSMSSFQFGLSEAAAAKYGKGSPQSKVAYKLGDMNTTLIRTYRGKTIMVQHNTTNPRPYSRINTLTGTKGTLADYPLRVALDPHAEEWMKEADLEALKAKYTHPLWGKNGEAAKAVGGHGGMDYLMDLRLCHCLQNGLPLDIDVYDTALWSSLVELTERSVLSGGKPMNVPDFTRGGWKTAEPLGIVTVG